MTQSARGPITSFEPVKAVDKEGLAIVTGEIHDAYVDLDLLVISGAAVSMPLSRGESRKRWIGWTTRLGDNPVWDAQLVVRGVAKVSVEDDQGIGTYSVNRIDLDEDAGNVRLDLNEAASAVFVADSVDVELQTVLA